MGICVSVPNYAISNQESSPRPTPAPPSPQSVAMVVAAGRISSATAPWVGSATIAKCQYCMGDW
jgi:hypothetical protein